MLGEIYQSVTRGELRGKARLYAKPFGTGIGDLGMVAANKFGAVWPYLLAEAIQKNRIEDSTVMAIVDSLKIDKAAFTRILHEKATTTIMVQSRDEGKRNGVSFTPGILIDNRYYGSFKDPRWIIDAVMYRYELKHR